MKKNSFMAAGLAGLLTLALALPAFAEDKEIAISGEGKCAKCLLKETDKCQNAIQVEKDGKKTTYYLVENDVSKKFQENLCEESKKVTATGTVKEVDGKQQLTAKKIELAKK